MRLRTVGITAMHWYKQITSIYDDEQQLLLTCWSSQKRTWSDTTSCESISSELYIPFSTVDWQAQSFNIYHFIMTFNYDTTKQFAVEWRTPSAPLWKNWNKIITIMLYFWQITKTTTRERFCYMSEWTQDDGHTKHQES